MSDSSLSAEPLTPEEEQHLRARDEMLWWETRRGSLWVKRMTEDWQTPTAEELDVHRLLATLDAERAASAARIAVLEGALRAVTNEAEYYVRASGHDYDAGLDEAVTAARAALSPATEAPHNPWKSPTSEFDNAHEAATRLRSEPIAKTGEGEPDHEHYWIDAPDDEAGWFCTICRVTEYPETPPFGANG